MGIENPSVHRLAFADSVACGWWCLELGLTKTRHVDL